MYYGAVSCEPQPAGLWVDEVYEPSAASTSLEDAVAPTRSGTGLEPDASLRKALRASGSTSAM